MSNFRFFIFTISLTALEGSVKPGSDNTIFFVGYDSHCARLYDFDS